MHCQILLITPYIHSRRGNSLTALRLQDGLRSASIDVHILSLENEHWQNNAREMLTDKNWNLLHGLHATSIAYAISAVPELQSLPLLLTMTGTDLNHDLFTARDSLTVQTVDQAKRLVVFNDYHLDLLGNLDRDWGKKAYVIPQGVVLPPAQLIPLPQLKTGAENTTFLLSCGLRPVKNVELALEGLELAYQKNDQLQLLLIGGIIDTEYGTLIKNKIDRLPWAFYGGEYPHEDIAGIIKQCDVVMNTSHHEGQPQAVLEAMSQGLPCLLNEVPGNLGLIKDGQEGYYISSSADIAEKALFLMEHPEIRRKMGIAARELVMQRHNPDQEINAYIRVYSEIINSTGGVD